MSTIPTILFLISCYLTLILHTYIPIHINYYQGIYTLVFYVHIHIMFSVQFICCHEMNPTCILDPDRRRIVFLVELLRSLVCLLNTFGNGAMAFISPSRQYGSPWLLYIFPRLWTVLFIVLLLHMYPYVCSKLSSNCGVQRTLIYWELCAKCCGILIPSKYV